MQIEARELTQISVNYLADNGVQEGRTRGPVPVRRYAISGTPLHTNSGLKDFRFAGLSGDLEVFVSVRDRVPLQISGDLRPIGRGHLKLKHVQLKAE